MTYLSPFKLLPFLSLDSSKQEEFNYPILKRKLLAEYELNDNQPIKVGEKFVGKSEALGVLDLLKDPEVLKQHLLLSKNTDLLNFLEKGDIKFFAWKDNHEIEIPEIIKEEFVQKYAESLAKFYQQNKADEVDLITQYPIEKVQASEEPFTLLYRKVKSDVNLLDEIQNSSNVKAKVQKIKQIIKSFNSKKARIANKLPAEYSYLLDELSRVSINISSDIFNHTKEKSLAKALCKFAAHIKASEELNDLAKQNLRIMSSDSSDGSSSWRTYLWAALAIIKILLLTTKCAH